MTFSSKSKTRIIWALNQVRFDSANKITEFRSELVQKWVDSSQSTSCSNRVSVFSLVLVCTQSLGCARLPQTEVDTSGASGARRTTAAQPRQCRNVGVKSCMFNPQSSCSGAERELQTRCKPAAHANSITMRSCGTRAVRGSHVVKTVKNTGPEEKSTDFNKGPVWK